MTMNQFISVVTFLIFFYIYELILSAISVTCFVTIFPCYFWTFHESFNHALSAHYFSYHMLSYEEIIEFRGTKKGNPRVVVIYCLIESCGFTDSFVGL